MDKLKLNTYIAGGLLAFGALAGADGVSQMSRALAYDQSAQIVNGNAAYTVGSPYPELDIAAKDAAERCNISFAIGGVSLFACIAVRALSDRRE